jgi:hypothetical protein
MGGVFVVLVDGQIRTYYKYEDIPQVIENVIKFLPNVPPPPHTDEQHREMDSHESKFKELLKRETR